MLTIDTFSKIEDNIPATITFFANAKYERYLYNNCHRAIIVPFDFSPKKPITATLIKVSHVYEAWRKVLNQFGQTTEISALIDPSASVSHDSVLYSNVSIGKYAIVGSHTIVKSDTIIMDQVFIGNNVLIGSRVTIFPGVRILDHCIIGDDVIIQCNTVIGSDGFGYSYEDSTYVKIPQKGNVVIEDQVEIGANVCIDRATLGSTVIGRGSKLDNLIQIAHNVVIGKNVAIAAQAGISGSSSIGSGAQLGGQSGVAGHITIAAGSRIQAQSGVSGDIRIANKKWFGYPVIEYWNYLRSYAIFKSLPDLKRKVEELEKRITQLSADRKD